MVYKIVKFLLTLTIHNFYRIKIRNANHVPLDTPLIIASNHTNAFLDSLAMAIVLKQNMYSLPRGNLFLSSSKILKWLFEGIGMIPIYRKLEGSENLKRNEETFERCFQIIKDKGTIHIYPEAICIYERRLKSVKKGAARILLGAEERNDFFLNSKVMICGLIYEEASKFNTNLLFNFSRPFSIQKSISIYKENNVLGINHLTQLIGEKMLLNMVHIANKELDALVGHIEIVYGPVLCQEYGFEKENQTHSFLLSREIAKGVNFYYDKDPVSLKRLGGRLAGYFDQLNYCGLKDHQITGVPILRTLIKAALLLLYGPFYLWGVTNHMIPLLASKVIADKVVKRIEFRGSVLALSGLCTLIVFYPLLIFLVFLIFNSLLIALLYGISLPIFGRLAFIISKKYRSAFLDLWYIYKKIKYTKEIIELKKERENILKDLRVMKDGFRRRHIK